MTPFDSSGAVAFDALERLAVESLEAGAAGLVALSTTGEATSLTDSERTDSVAVCAAVCATYGRSLIVGAGTNDTRTTIANHEALAGVPGVRASLAVVPYYVRPSEQAVVAHFRYVADRSPVPMIVYNIPYRTARGLGPSALLDLAATDNIDGVKQSVGGIDADTLTVLAEAPAGFAVLGGDDPFLFPLTLMGGAGAISAAANLHSDRFVAMIEDGLSGRVDAGRKLAETLLPFTLALFAEPSPAVIKAVLHADGRIPTADVRMPLAAASAAARSAALAARP